MYTQLKQFADPTPDPNNETEGEDEMLLWVMRDRRRNNDEGSQHEDRDVLHSKMKAYTDLVFEYAKQTVKQYGEEKVLEVQNWGYSPAPWKRASADLVVSERKKLVTRERIMKWIKYLLEHLLCETRRRNIRTGDWRADGTKLLTVSSKPDSVHV